MKNSYDQLEIQAESFLKRPLRARKLAQAPPPRQVAPAGKFVALADEATRDGRQRGRSGLDRLSNFLGNLGVGGGKPAPPSKVFSKEGEIEVSRLVKPQEAGGLFSSSLELSPVPKAEELG